METEPLEGINQSPSGASPSGESPSGEPPEDVAILYSWANLQGAKYRDFSANRREYRAQMRHRAAEQLRLMELRAQSEAEVAAAQAEVEAAAAHAEADAATVKLAASRSMPAVAPEEIRKEKEVEEVRNASLREAAQQARRAAAERLEAARRAEAASLANSIARREEREIAEAQASALRQAAQYHESELRNKRSSAEQREDQVPGRISDPYLPQILAEGEYYDGPGTPPSELEASRFRVQREYIERSTGSELPQFKMPPVFQEDRPLRGERDSFSFSTQGPMQGPMQRAERAGRREEEVRHDASTRDPDADLDAARVNSYRESCDSYGDARRPAKVEVVSRIPDVYPDGGPVGRFEDDRFEDSKRGSTREGTRDDTRDSTRDDKRGMGRYEPERGWEFAADDRWQPGRNGLERESQAREIRAVHRADAVHGSIEDERPQVYPVTPRTSGSWLREIAARESEAYPEARHEAKVSLEPSASPIRPFGIHAERASFRQSPELRYEAEVAHEDGRRSDVAGQPEQRPRVAQSFAQSFAQSRTGIAGETPVAERPVAEKPGPRWLYPEQPKAPAAKVAAAEFVAASNVNDHVQPEEHEAEAENTQTETGNTLQATRERVASRWFALKGVFARRDASEPVEWNVPREKASTPMIAVYSVAGGVGKTSLVATLGRALSSLSEKVLLVDATSQGLLPFYFGANESVSGVVRTFNPPSGSTDAPIHLVSYDPDQIGVDGQAQAALVEGLLSSSQQANRVLLDLNGGCGWLVERLARLKPTILVPVAADMNSIISLQTVEKKFAAMQSADGEPLQPVYLLNQFDASLPLHLDLREVLRQQLGDRLLPFVIRRAAGISEALAEGMTIVDYDLDSSATHDFLAVANWIRTVSAPAAAVLRSLRWSEG